MSGGLAMLPLSKGAEDGRPCKGKQPAAEIGRKIHVSTCKECVRLLIHTYGRRIRVDIIWKVADYPDLVGAFQNSHNGWAALGFQPQHSPEILREAMDDGGNERRGAENDAATVGVCSRYAFICSGKLWHTWNPTCSRVGAVIGRKRSKSAGRRKDE
ncbi:hypothetical protein Salat_1157800 [Sesamum alatum]|uniref:Uncharacterized protein n=1 Tax=Sesamum alatum TaxID=300844 RepID=A0AAE1YEF1_9LAMI|nr:hypothetical protein Salat_1157800 [Sesamum alatum]